MGYGVWGLYQYFLKRKHFCGGALGGIWRGGRCRILVCVVDGATGDSTVALTCFRFSCSDRFFLSIRGTTYRFEKQAFVEVHGDIIRTPDCGTFGQSDSIYVDNTYTITIVGSVPAPLLKLRGISSSRKTPAVLVQHVTANRPHLNGMHETTVSLNKGTPRGHEV